MNMILGKIGIDDLKEITSAACPLLVASSNGAGCCKKGLGDPVLILVETTVSADTDNHEMAVPAACTDPTAVARPDDAET